MRAVYCIQYTNIHYTVYSILCKVYIIQYTVDGVKVHSVKGSMGDGEKGMLCAMYSVRYTV